MFGTGNRLISFIGVLLAAFAAATSMAYNMPACPLNSSGAILQINNADVLGWKRTMPNGRPMRAHIQGTLVHVDQDRSGHHHFDVQIGPQPSDLIEVIYQIDEGRTPNFQVGSTMEACGDYKTANRSSPWPSRDGAIIHWLHYSSNPYNHLSGWLAVNGQVYGSRR